MFFNKYRLEDITDKIGDGIHGTPEYDDNGDFYFVNGNNLVHGDIVFKNDTKRINEEQYLKNKRDLNKNTLLVSINGTLGNVAKYNNEKIILGKSVCYINVKDEYNVDYVYFVFESPKFKKYLQYGANGTTIKNVPLSAIRNYEISIPSKENQDKIVKILKSIEDKIKLNNKINNNLYEFNNKLFEEKILNNAEKDDWEEYLLSDISKMINGYSYKGNELVEKSNIGMATIKNFERTGGFKLDGFKDIVPQKCKSDHYVKPFEILVACTDLTQNADIIGNAIMLLNNANYDEIIMSMDLVKLIPITDIVNNYMLYAIVNSKDFKNFALRYKSGTTVLHLNKNCFKEYTIKLPNYNTIKDLSKVFEGNYKKISQIVDENRKLEQLRDTLLPELMNGEIDLDNIEI